MSDDQGGIGDLLEHGPWLERLAQSLVQDPHAAADAVQSTWLSALRHPPTTKTRGRAWLRTVLLHEVLQAHRKGQRRQRHEELAAPTPAPEEDPVTESGVQELRAELVHLVRALPEPYRSTLHLHFFQELSPKEISAKLGVPAPTVRWRLMTGLDRLRDEIRRRHPDRPLHLLLLPLTSRVAPDGDAAITSVRPRRLSLRGPLAAAAAMLAVGLVGLLALLSSTGGERPNAVAHASTPRTEIADVLALPGASRGRTELSSAAPADLGPQAIEADSAAVPLLWVQVEDANGLSVPGAAVLAFRRASGRFEEIGRTDGQGRASVAADAADIGAFGGKGTSGRIALRAAAPGWAQSDVVFASVPRREVAVRLVLPARETVFAGHVVDERGEPVPGAEVGVGYAQSNQLSGVVEADPSLPQPVSVRSDEHGRFRVEGADGSSGRARIQAAAPGFVSGFLEQIVDGSAERSCRIVLSRGGILRGCVRGREREPVSFARVWHEPAEQGGDAAVRSPGYVARLRGWSTSAEADAEGRFELAGVPPGRQLVWAQDPATARSVASALVDVASGAPAEWNPELEERDPLEIVLDGIAGGSAGWIVRLWFPGPDGRRCIREEATDATGTVRYFDVEGVDVDVSVFAPDTGFLAARSKVKRGVEPSVRLRVDPPALVEGRLLDSRGAPLADALLRVVPEDGLAPWTQIPHDRIDGSFVHGLPPCAYGLFLSRHGANLRVASFTIAPGTRVDLGEIRCPALGRLRIEAQGFAPAEGLEYRILQEKPPIPASLNPRVEIGTWPPPLERELLHGTYTLEIGSFLAKELRVDRRWTVELAEGGTTTLRAGP